MSQTKVQPDLRALSAAARQGEWTLEPMENHGMSAADRFTSYGIECAGHTILDTLNSGGGCLNSEVVDDETDHIWDEQARCDLAFVAALVNAYRSGALVEATPRTAMQPVAAE